MPCTDVWSPITRVDHAGPCCLASMTVTNTLHGWSRAPSRVDGDDSDSYSTIGQGTHQRFTSLSTNECEARKGVWRYLQHLTYEYSISLLGPWRCGGACFSILHLSLTSQLPQYPLSVA
jgi:hypothetical protein